MKRLATLIVSILMLITPWKIQGQNTARKEIFSDSRTLYRTTGSKKWRPAAIHIEPDKIEVYRRRGAKGRKLELIANFESGKVESEQRKFYRSNAAALTSAIGGGIISGLIIVAITQEGTVITGKDGVSRRVEGINVKNVLLMYGAVAGIATAIGLTKSKRPYAQITSGMRSVELQVHKREGLRFESALQTFRANSNRD